MGTSGAGGGAQGLGAEKSFSAKAKRQAATHRLANLSLVVAAIAH